MTRCCHSTLFSLICLLVTGGSSQLDAADMVDFNRDIRPVLAHRCFECHGKNKASGKLRLDSRAAVLKGGREGPALVVGNSTASLLVKLISSTEADEVMPPKGPRLTKAEIARIKAWIDQGAKWGVPVVVDRGPPPSVAPRRTKLPAGAGNPIDRLLGTYFKSAKFTPPPLVDDDLFARRVYLDAIGLLPTPEELRAFRVDRSPDKRARLVAKLLVDKRRYTDHWITFWQDLLRDGKKDLGTTDVFRPITDWLEHSLLTNKPVDRMVRELIDPANADLLDKPRVQAADAGQKDKTKKINDSVGFLFGLQGGLEVPRGDQAWQVQGVQNLAQVFLGVQLKCATCHDSFLDRWTMDETWAFASIYSKQPLEVTRCEVPTGRKPVPRFLFPEVGNVDPRASVAIRRKQLAELMTSPRNGRFARTIVNRLWARLMGRGIIATVDDMSGKPFDADLLDWLASDLVEHKYDLKRTIGLILTSKAYQLPAIGDGEAFRGPLVRRMTAEQFVDAGRLLAGQESRVWHKNGDRLLEVLGRPDRRTVVTERLAKASPLQALELLNGAELHELIYTIKLPKKETPDGLASRLFEHALSRTPSERELKVCLSILGPEPTAKQAGDLLWSLLMLPEFQLIQ